MERIKTPFISRESTVRKGKKTAVKKKTVVLILGCLLLCLAVILSAMYFLFPIKNIVITGNHYLSEEYIRKTVGISEGDRYFFRLNGRTAAEAQKDPLFSEIRIKRADNLSYIIEVIENTIVGYQITGSSTDVTSTLILADGQIIPFSAEYMKNIALTPMFIDISIENCKNIARQLGKLDFDIISRISEVSTVAFTYDENMVKLTMEDGYRVYSSVNGLGYMKDYFDIVINKSNASGSCILIMEEYSSAAILECSEIREKYIRTAD
ncbi:MAG: FtsQ-type POTRA domain-containing protein [Erysipelotrichaceae bacterium]|nr:FtsQ-type POTRA domain-containing protein [Erysipelotrichaceae bacterium]